MNTLTSTHRCLIAMQTRMSRKGQKAQNLSGNSVIHTYTGLKPRQWSNPPDHPALTGGLTTDHQLEPPLDVYCYQEWVYRHLHGRAHHVQAKARLDDTSFQSLGAGGRMRCRLHKRDACTAG